MDDRAPTQGAFTWIFGALSAVVAFLLVAVGIVAVATKDDRASSSVVAGAPTTVEVTLTEFKVVLNPPTVPAGLVTLHVTNSGTQIHNVSIAQLNKKTADLAPGASASLELGDVTAGSYEVICAIAGHAAAGMKTTLTVGAATASAAGSSARQRMSSGRPAIANMRAS